MTSSPPSSASAKEDFSAAPSPLFFFFPVLCSSSSSLVMLLLLLLLPAAAYYSYLLLFRRLRASRHRDAAAPDPPLPPGDEGLPILGETLRLISAYKTEDPETFMDKRVARYGRVFTSHIFGERTVFSSDPEFNRLVVHGEGKLFEWSYPRSITALLGRHALVLSKGPYHKRMHSLTLSTFSSHSALRDHLLPDVDRLVRLNLRSWADGQVLHLLDQAKKITFDMAVKQLLSFEPGEWTEGLRKEYKHLIDGFFSLPIPLFSFTTYGRAVQARRRVAEALRLVVRQRMSVFQQQKQQQSQQQQQEKQQQKRSCREVDMLETLLAQGVTEEEQVVDFLLALLVAGYDTTSTSMTLAVKFLSESPAALAALREEHDAIIRRKREKEEQSGGGAGGGRGEGDPELPLRWIDYKSFMPFTHCVINETLRMGNIVSGVFRRATTDIPVKGYTIPKGCKVFASFRAVHMDPDYHDDARTFNPWRWQQQQQPKKKEEELPHQHQQQTQQHGEQQALPLQQHKLKKQHQTSGLNVFTPFGGGTRLCPGYELARVELAVFLHHLVTTFSWEAVDDDRLVFFPTTRTLKGYPIRVHHRPRIHV